MTVPDTLRLDGFDSAVFLRDTWQRRPLLIRNPWGNWRNPITADELAGLACEAGTEARLVRRTPKTWKVAHGPFDAARFARLGKHPWTLLVQAVDHHVPAVAALIAPFRFIPDWRIDDVMVSAAGDGGGVGPHFDNYDVFLVQGAGRRRWRVGGRCDAATPLLPHDDLRLLESFEATDEWLLEPGDMLYVPPGFAHDGVAVGDGCMTYSIGFRAPSRAELIAHWCDHLLAELDEDDRYADPELRPQANPGEIQAAALARLHAMVAERMLDEDAFARWFGTYNTEPKNPHIDWRPDTAVAPHALAARIAAGMPLRRNPASRFAFIRQDGGMLLFVDGDAIACADDTAMLAEDLCADDRLTVDPGLAASNAVIALLTRLIAQGCLAFDGAD